MTSRSHNQKGVSHHVQPTFSTGKIHATFAEATPSVYRLVSDTSEGFISIRLSYRGPHDWLAIGKRYGDDGSPEVIFGSGVDFASALLGLEASIDQNKWRPDKFLK